MPSLRSIILVTLLACYHVAECVVSAAEEQEEIKKARQKAKPWLMRNLTVGGVTVPLSPASLIGLFVFLVNIVWAFTGESWCEASHLLIKDTSPKTKKAMEEMVKDLGGNARKFAEMATKYSQCPSKVKNGDLGRFKEGDMAPQFNQICFDPKTKLNTTLGPIETQFGYHLIYIRQRKL